MINALKYVGDKINKGYWDNGPISICSTLREYAQTRPPALREGNWRPDGYSTCKRLLIYIQEALGKEATLEGWLETAHGVPYTSLKRFGVYNAIRLRWVRAIIKAIEQDTAVMPDCNFATYAEVPWQDE